MAIKVVNHPTLRGEYAIQDTERDVYFLSPLGELIHTRSRANAESIKERWEKGVAKDAAEQPRRLELYRIKYGYR